MVTRTDKLQGFEDANKMPGDLRWSIGYYEKSALNQALKKEPNANVPKEIKEEPKAQETGTVADSKDELDALRIPPDANCPSGILSVIIHQINNLERQDIKGTTGSREGQSGQDTTEAVEEGEHLPNSYCEIIMNDDLVYKTRVKQYTSMPYFEAGTERFVRDWRNTVVRVQVRDARSVQTVFFQEFYTNTKS
jgi:Ca2+-dependent lipid-binding protein